MWRVLLPPSHIIFLKANLHFKLALHDIWRLVIKYNVYNVSWLLYFRVQIFIRIERINLSFAKVHHYSLHSYYSRFETHVREVWYSTFQNFGALDTIHDDVLKKTRTLEKNVTTPHTVISLSLSKYLPFLKKLVVTNSIDFWYLSTKESWLEMKPYLNSFAIVISFLKLNFSYI